MRASECRCGISQTVDVATLTPRVREVDDGTADMDLVREVFETDYFGVIMVTSAMIPPLRRSAQPRTVNVTSGVPWLRGPIPGTTCRGYRRPQVTVPV
jgi:NAD(P)-dependent dehydrogenase (short-subunit alcohol dehydrogenase family)